VVDEIDDYETRLRRSRRIRWAVIGVVLGGGVIGAFAYVERAQRHVHGAKLPAAERAKVHALAEAARKKAAAAKDAFPVKIREAGGWRARPDLGACPATVPAVGEREDEVQLNIVDRDDLAGAKLRSLSAARLDNAAELAGAGADEDDWLPGVDAVETTQQRFARVTPYEIILVVDDEQAPHADGVLSRSGRASGRALLWDLENGTVVCAADVTAENSDRVTAQPLDLGSGVKAPPDLQAALDKDLREQLEVAAGTATWSIAGP